MTDRQPLDYVTRPTTPPETTRDTKSDDTALLALAVGSVLAILIALAAGVALGAWAF